MTEAIDTSQWLPRGQSTITHERLAKGGMICRNSVYQQEHPHIIDWMLDNELIDTFQHAAASDIITLREVALSAVGVARLSALTDWLGGRSNTTSCPMTTYSRIMRSLIPWQRARIERLCFEAIYERDKAWIQYYNHGTQQSFDSLQKAIDDTRKNSLQSEIEEGTTAPKFYTPA